MTVLCLFIQQEFRVADRTLYGLQVNSVHFSTCLSKYLSIFPSYLKLCPPVHLSICTRYFSFQWLLVVESCDPSVPGSQPICNRFQCFLPRPLLPALQPGKPPKCVYFCKPTKYKNFCKLTKYKILP